MEIGGVLFGQNDHHHDGPAGQRKKRVLPAIPTIICPC